MRIMPGRLALLLEAARRKKKLGWPNRLFVITPEEALALLEELQALRVDPSEAWGEGYPAESWPAKRGEA